MEDCTLSIIENCVYVKENKTNSHIAKRKKLEEKLFLFHYLVLKYFSTYFIFIPISFSSTFTH